VISFPSWQGLTRPSSFFLQYHLDGRLGGRP
jgi:hypothetical protein